MSMTTFGHGNLIATDINKHITSKALQRIESPFDNLNIENKKKEWSYCELFSWRGIGFSHYCNTINCM